MLIVEAIGDLAEETAMSRLTMYMLNNTYSETVSFKFAIKDYGQGNVY